MFSKKYTVRLKIEGMKCEGCVKRIENVLSSIPFVVSSSISLTEKEAMVIFKKQDTLSMITQKIENLGFDVSVVSSDIS